MMKRLFVVALASVAAAVSLSAQTTNAEFKSRYESQVKRVGYDGLGVETLLDRWEKAFPEDVDMLVGKFNLYLGKSVSTEVVKKDQERFMGEKPMLTLKDSLDNDVNYFQETFYDDSLFAMSAQAIDKAIKLNPDRLDLRFCKITSLMAYEKESPDMATAALSSLIDYNGTARPSWKYGDEEVEKDLFETGIQEYCASLFGIGSPTSYESFRTLSEKMLKYIPDSPVFMSNLGSYYFVSKKDNKTAAKYYNKVLKKDPENYTSIKNMVLMSRKDKNVKQEKKYLDMLQKYSPDEMERQSAKVRLEALNK
ncbi:MAG: hypothetical protein Q4G10_05000 [Bacteroidia bacterium]|nr:hypothetical protein [Bacteroidia bacterium]